MKTSRTATFETEEELIQFDSSRFIQLSVISALIVISALLIYFHFYLTTIFLIVLVYIVTRAYRVYKEILEFDWTIDNLDITAEDIMKDLGN